MNSSETTLVTIAVALAAAIVLVPHVIRRRRRMSVSEWRAGMIREGIGVGEPCGYYLLTQDSRGMWVAYDPRDEHNWKEFYVEADARTFQTVAISNYLKRYLSRRRRLVELKPK